MYSVQCTRSITRCSSTHDPVLREAGAVLMPNPSLAINFVLLLFCMLLDSMCTITVSVVMMYIEHVK